MLILILNNFKKNIGFDINNTSIVNFIASFFLGIFVALDIINNDIILLLYTGFCEQGIFARNCKGLFSH